MQKRGLTEGEQVLHFLNGLFGAFQPSTSLVGPCSPLITISAMVWIAASLLVYFVETSLTSGDGSSSEVKEVSTEIHEQGRRA